MRNDEINFDEIIEGINDAKSACEDAEENFNDCMSHAEDTRSYADDAKDKLTDIERTLDDLLDTVRTVQNEAVEPGVDLDEVQSFIIATIQDSEIIGARITDIKSRCMSYAKGFGLDITVSDVFPDGR